MKKVYIVKGSADGNIGVYSNIKKAYEKAVNYINSPEGYEQWDQKDIPSYNTVCKKIKKCSYYPFNSLKYSINSEIEMFYLNR